MADKRPPIQPSRQPPRLLDLVRKHGGYDKITPEAWAEWDKEIAEYRADVAKGALWRKLGDEAADVVKTASANRAQENDDAPPDPR